VQASVVVSSRIAFAKRLTTPRLILTASTLAHQKTTKAITAAIRIAGLRS
jgi:hypothetical protein